MSERGWQVALILAVCGTLLYAGAHYFPPASIPNEGCECPCEVSK